MADRILKADEADRTDAEVKSKIKRQNNPMNDVEILVMASGVLVWMVLSVTLVATAMNFELVSKSEIAAYRSMLENTEKRT